MNNDFIIVWEVGVWLMSIPRFSLLFFHVVSAEHHIKRPESKIKRTYNFGLFLKKKYKKFRFRFTFSCVNFTTNLVLREIETEWCKNYIERDQLSKVHQKLETNNWNLLKPRQKNILNNIKRGKTIFCRFFLWTMRNRDRRAVAKRPLMVLLVVQLNDDDAGGQWESNRPSA